MEEFLLKHHFQLLHVEDLSVIVFEELQKQTFRLINFLVPFVFGTLKIIIIEIIKIIHSSATHRIQS